MQVAWREIETSRPSHGPLRSKRVGPNSATIGVPTAPAMCSGPVSPDTISAALRAMPTRSVIVVGGATSALAEEAATTADASACSPGPQSTTERRPASRVNIDASAPKRSGGHRLFGHAAPGLRIA
jgi:hypothetical protein